MDFGICFSDRFNFLGFNFGELIFIQLWTGFKWVLQMDGVIEPLILVGLDLDTTLKSLQQNRKT